MFEKLVDESSICGVGFRIFPLFSQLGSDSQIGIASRDRIRKLPNHCLPTLDGIGCGVGSFGLLSPGRLQPEINAPSKEDEDQEEGADEDLLLVKRPKNFGIKGGQRLRWLRRRCHWKRSYRSSGVTELQEETPLA